MKTKVPAKAHTFHIPVDRRRFFKSMAAVSADFTLSGYLAEALTATPSTTQGPYYPLAHDIALDKNNDLVQLGDNLTAAAGIVTHVTGRVLDTSGNPIKNILVQLWHADREGDYQYSTGVGRNPACDANFAGFGQFLTGSSGAFKFRTTSDLIAVSLPRFARGNRIELFNASRRPQPPVARCALSAVRPIARPPSRSTAA